MPEPNADSQNHADSKIHSDPNAGNIWIRGGRVIDPSRGVDHVGDVLIIDGVVASIAEPDDAPPNHSYPTIDARGCIVAPGLVDLATELRQPGYDEDETIASGSAAAVAGGYTTLLVAGNNDPCTDSPGAVEFIRQAARDVDARIAVMGCVSKDREGDQLSEIGLLVAAGAAAFGDVPRPIHNDALLKRALEYCRMFDRVIINRPGVPSLSRGGVMHDGQTSLVLGLRGIPTEAEDLAVARDVRMIEATGGRLHVGPISTMGAVDMIRGVKTRGVAVTASVCPHNLMSDDTSLRSFDSRFKVHPPLRSPRHVETIRGALEDGTIDAIASGHMPRSREKKMNDLDLAPFGASMLETAMSVVATVMVQSGRMDWPRLIDAMSTRPAQIAGLNAGSIAVGSPGDVAVINPNTEWTVDAASMNSRCISSPVDGQTLNAAVTHTIVGGKVSYRRVS